MKNKQRKAFTLLEMIMVLALIAFLIGKVITEVINPLFQSQYYSYLDENFKKIENNVQEMMKYPDRTFSCVNYAMKIGILYSDEPNLILKGLRQCSNQIFPDIVSNFPTKDYYDNPIIMETTIVFPGQFKIEQLYNNTTEQMNTQISTVDVPDTIQQNCMGISNNTSGDLIDYYDCIPYIQVNLIGIGEDGDILHEATNYQLEFSTEKQILNYYKELQSELHECSLNMINNYYNSYISHNNDVRNYFFNNDSVFIETGISETTEDYNFILSGPASGKNKKILGNNNYNVYPTEIVLKDEWLNCSIYQEPTFGQSESLGMTGWIYNSDNPQKAYYGYVLYPFINFNSLNQNQVNAFISTKTNIENEVTLTPDIQNSHTDVNYMFTHLNIDNSINITTPNELDTALSGIIYIPYEYSGRYF